VSTRDTIVKVLSEHGSGWWDDQVRGLYADDLVSGGFDLTDPQDVATSLWSMGASKPASDAPFHAGCVYGDPDDPRDADYENDCEPCQTRLAELAEKIAEAMPEPTDSGPA
jgi:hypothetical protein